MKKVKIAIAGAAASLLLIGAMSSFQSSPEKSKVQYWKRTACPQGLSGYVCIASNAKLPLCYANQADNIVGGKYKWGFYNCHEK